MLTQGSNVYISGHREPLRAPGRAGAPLEHYTRKSCTPQVLSTVLLSLIVHRATPKQAISKQPFHFLHDSVGQELGRTQLDNPSLILMVSGKG